MYDDFANAELLYFVVESTFYSSMLTFCCSTHRLRAAACPRHPEANWLKVIIHRKETLHQCWRWHAFVCVANMKSVDTTINFLERTIKLYYVYILASKRNGTLYVGSTNDLVRRILEHKNKAIPGFTEKYDINQLVYYEEHELYVEAARREKRFKNWPRQWKLK